MHSVPSSDFLLLTRPHVTSFYGGSSFHRLKHLHKSDRRVSSNLDTTRILFVVLGIASMWLQSIPVDINKCNVVREDECNDSDNRKTSNSSFENYFSNRVTFPALAEPKSSVDGLLGEEKGHKDYKTSEVDESTIKSVNQCYSQSISQPVLGLWLQTPLKPVSAMKGSREKQGTTPKQLSVTWAPDVYDPTPTAESHVPSSKNQRYRNDGKKHGKNKHKSSDKSSRGSKGKDKKQARKNGGGTTKLKPLQDDSVVVVGVSEPQVGSVDFNVVSPNAFCGSSFLKESVTNLHFPVTEAT
ncbi:hypothetical protein DH2020_040121 [Rehmannia glutinosa]|uniref:Uncharacterized protein n=1 Tax=Rehmannia glutinosa TaxID=99300 RepID=A0ABR0UTW4_REHGL